MLTQEDDTIKVYKGNDDEEESFKKQSEEPILPPYVATPPYVPPLQFLQWFHKKNMEDQLSKFFEIMKIAYKYSSRGSIITNAFLCQVSQKNSFLRSECWKSSEQLI